MSILWLSPYVISGLLSFIVNLSIGIFVFSQNPKDSKNQLFALFSFAVSGWSVGSFLENVITDPSLALGVLRVNYCFGIVLPAFYVHFVYVLVGITEKRRNEVKCLYGISLILLPFIATPWFIKTLRVIHPYEFRISQPGPVYFVFFGVFCYSIYRVLSTLWKAFNASSQRERMELGYLLLANSIAVLAGLEYFSTVFRLIQRPPLDDYLLVVYFGILAYAIVKHQLLDIRIVLRRSLVYSVLIALITAVYLVMVLVMERWFAGFFGYRSIFSTLIIAFLIAVFFNPVRERIQSFVDRALFQATAPELAIQREQLLEQVRKGDQMKAVGTLAAGLAHEIKNPLASIKTFTEHLSAKHDDPQFREKFQKIVGGEVERINLIVHQLLEFAKPVPPKLMPVDASKILEDTLALLNSELVSRHVQVTKSFTDSPPILADPQQLKQVFLNLLLNSLQAMNGDGRLTLTTAPKGGELLVTLEDTGCGIPQENLNRLGEPFFSTKPAGTGLGLAVVQSIVREHQGKLQITSQLGQGTRVELRIPLAA